jgi:ribosomal protein S18 acetylase RimI-like enzyme
MVAAEIRRATPEDAVTVALLGRITFAESFRHLFRSHPHELRSYLDSTFGVGKIEISLQAPENVYWLAFRDLLPIGYAKLKHPSAPSDKAGENAAQLQKIYVLNEFLGERIGGALLRQVSPEAKRRAPKLWLDVLHENERAIGFYRKHGFSITGEDTYRIGSQTFLFDLMSKPLT